MAVGSQHDRDGAAGVNPGGGDEKDGRHADDLLSHLRKGRDVRFLHSVIIAVDTGVKGGKGNRDANDWQVRCTARLHQNRRS